MALRARSATNFQRRQAKRSTFPAVTVDTLCFRGSTGAPLGLVLSVSSCPSMLKNVDLPSLRVRRLSSGSVAKSKG